MNNIQKGLWTFVAVVAAGLVWGAGAVKAINYGNGYYTNLCDSGTAATYYNCNSGCNPTLGSCSGTNDGVVKWVCTGKWNQCLESESQWSNYEKVDSVGCGYTVQLSMFDKKCRRLDGSWDNTCQLLGYMVWYSGDCYSAGTVIGGNGISSVPTSTPTPRVVATPTLVPKPTQTPTPTPVKVLGSDSKLAGTLTATPKVLPTPTPLPVVNVCGAKCKVASDCRVGFACVNGQCRNPACTADKSCFCKTAGEATASAVTNKTPDTGVDTWLGMLSMGVLGFVGLRMRSMAKKVW